jgi:cystathionine gamma-synthase/methionine-gamma-lyase
LKRKTNKQATLAVHAGDRKKLGEFTPTTTPIYATSSFFYDSSGDLERVFNEEKEGCVYSRYGNPTVSAFESQLATLEGADYAVATASGMAAIHMAVLGGLLDRRKSIVAADVLYGQTTALLQKVFEPFGVETRYADPCDLPAFEAAVAKARPGCVFVESMSNPLLRVPALDKVAEIAKRYGAQLIVDATFTTPVLSRPLELGVDIVVHSATKYLSGHGDTLGGVILGKQESYPTIHYLRKTLGPNASPFDSYLAMRGVKTLSLRMERQCRNAAFVARQLAECSAIERVYFPGNPDHPDYETCVRLFPEGLFGAMVSFDLAGGRERVLAFLDALEMTVPATSLGDVQSMALYPAMSSHRDLAPKHRQRLGIGDGLVRLSVGIEDASDIIDDIVQAVEHSEKVVTQPATDQRSGS